MSKSPTKKPTKSGEPTPNPPGRREMIDVAVADLIPFAANSRTHSDGQVAQIAAAIREFGWTSPLLIQPDRTIIAGHGRLLAARKLGLDSVPCIVLDGLTPAQVRALVIADNKLALNAGWDDALLASELQGIIADGGVDMQSIGFSEDELSALFAVEKNTMDEGDPDDVPAEAAGEPVSQRGEVYELGSHRLMCGDSTSTEDWQSLLGAEIADAVMTDPPYGVNYKGKTADAMEIENDDPEGLPALLDGALGNVLARCKDGGAWYVAAPAGPLSLIFENWLFGKGILRQCIVWVKDSMVLGHSDYHYKHEPVYYGWKPGAPHRAPPDRTQVSVWEIARPKRSKEHPTMKPVELYERMMRNSTLPNEIVLEPFGGSGTTLIAAAKTGRVCRAMELAPRYCDVIRRRRTKFAKENNRPAGTGALE